ncbi:MAG TPA: hypothetical protein VFU29_23040, partial [Chitinophagaceae bacterium]|nr:hypothetical protein [Chitinophagaceae bacterium]
MKNKIVLKKGVDVMNELLPKAISKNGAKHSDKGNVLPEILFITSYPPRECGIATYSQDLIKALNNKFNHSFKLRICALESENEKHDYTDEIKYVLNTDHPEAFTRLVKTINNNADIRIVMIQHEFGFYAKRENDFRQFLEALTKPVV